MSKWYRERERIVPAGVPGQLIQHLGERQHSWREVHGCVGEIMSPVREVLPDTQG